MKGRGGVRLKSDEVIVKQLIQKNEEGLENLIDKYAPLLKSVIQKQLYGLPAYQEECLSDVLLAIWNHAAQYDAEKSSLKNWICAIARYRSINYLKKYRNELNQLQWEEKQTNEKYVEDQPFEQELWEFQLEKLLAPLSQKDQQLFKDIFSTTFTTEEVATKHRLTKGALYSRVSRGKRKIRDFFNRKEEMSDEERKQSL